MIIPRLPYLYRFKMVLLNSHFKILIFSLGLCRKQRSVELFKSIPPPLRTFAEPTTTNIISFCFSSNLKLYVLAADSYGHMLIAYSKSGSKLWNLYTQIPRNQSCRNMEIVGNDIIVVSSVFLRWKLRCISAINGTKLPPLNRSLKGARSSSFFVKEQGVLVTLEDDHICQYRLDRSAYKFRKFCSIPLTLNANHFESWVSYNESTNHSCILQMSRERVLVMQPSELPQYYECSVYSLTDSRKRLLKQVRVTYEGSEDFAVDVDADDIIYFIGRDRHSQATHLLASKILQKEAHPLSSSSVQPEHDFLALGFAVHHFNHSILMRIRNDGLILLVYTRGDGWCVFRCFDG